MRNALAPVATLLVGVSILLTGLGLQGTLLPGRASLEACSTFAIGSIENDGHEYRCAAEISHLQMNFYGIR